MFKVSNLIGFGAGVVGIPTADKLLLESGDLLLLEDGISRLKLDVLAIDPFFDSVELLVLFDGSSIDLSNNAHTLTQNGNAQIDSTDKKFGSGSALFDGTNDYYSVPGGTWWDFGTADFTIETHVRLTGGGSDGLIGRDATSGAENRWILFLDGGGNIEWWATSEGQLLGTGIDYRDSVWYHVAVSRNSDTTRLFIDGGLKDSTTMVYDITTSAENLILGSDPASISSRSMTGNLDSVRVTKGVGRYTANFIPPTENYPIS